MKIVTFGEIMLRLKTPEHLRIIQSQNFEASYGGAEANVAVSLENTVQYLWQNQKIFAGKIFFKM